MNFLSKTQGRRVENINGNEGVCIGSESKPKKKRFKIRYFLGALTLTAAIGVGAFWGYKTGKFDFLKNKNDDNLNKDEYTTIADSLPLDDEGIVNITYPLVDRTFGEAKGRFSLPAGFVKYYFDTTPEDDQLKSFKNSTTNNVNDYEVKVEGTKPTGCIGLANDYAGFMEKIEGIKAKIAAGDATYTASLEQVEHEVSNLYKIPGAYDLYTEDENAKKEVQLAYIDTDKSKVFMIPSEYVDNFIGVKSEICELIAKYEGLREQVILAYDTYNNNAREYLGDINEETTNRSR